MSLKVAIDNNGIVGFKLAELEESYIEEIKVPKAKIPAE
jgi:hypothetical protein